MFHDCPEEEISSVVERVNINLYRVIKKAIH